MNYGVLTYSIRHLTELERMQSFEKAVNAMNNLAKKAEIMQETFVKFNDTCNRIFGCAKKKGK